MMFLMSGVRSVLTSVSESFPYRSACTSSDMWTSFLESSVVEKSSVKSRLSRGRPVPTTTRASGVPLVSCGTRLPCGVSACWRLAGVSPCGTSSVSRMRLPSSEEEDDEDEKDDEDALSIR